MMSVLLQQVVKPIRNEMLIWVRAFKRRRAFASSWPLSLSLIRRCGRSTSARPIASVRLFTA
eukprot:2899553-Pleurochrysis_carterae.AAC.1